MYTLSKCPLTPAQLALLQLYALERTSNTTALALISGRSVDTIETQFKQINKILGTGKRDEALLIEDGLPCLSPTTTRPDVMEGSHTGFPVWRFWKSFCTILPGTIARLNTSFAGGNLSALALSSLSFSLSYTPNSLPGDFCRSARAMFPITFDRP